MENAAKAILIAGGILIGLMTLTLLVYAGTATRRMEQAQHDKSETEKIAKFNMEFEAYNKHRLYGIDVITVINKAIAHNKKMDAIKDPDNRYYINVIFYTYEPFKNTVTKKENTEGSNGNEDTITDPTNILNTDNKPNLETMKILLGKEVGGIKENHPNKLGDFVDNNNNFVTNLNFKEIFDSNLVNDIVETNIEKNTIYTYKLNSALTNFKKAVFACSGNKNETKSGVEYSKDGIIKSITFYQVDPKDNKIK